MNGQRIRKRWGPQTNGGRKKKAECLKKKRGNAKVCNNKRQNQKIKEARVH